MKLTQLSTTAGCAAKLSQDALRDVLRGFVAGSDARLLVSQATSDDAGVFKIRDDLALVQTVDFFTPIVDDPYQFGQIAATNALSDVYAMGGRPLTAMNLLAVPQDKLSPADIGRILLGGATKVKQAGASLVGGHTIRAPEPIYGLSVTGVVHPDHVLTNAGARPGDWLVLTKPLGTGIITTAIKRELASDALARRCSAVMRRLNTPGADLAEQRLVHAATDVTGFGLLGHLANICRGSNVSAEIVVADVPVIAKEVMELIAAGCVPGGSRSNVRIADEITDWGDASDNQRVLLCDAQTSGGLLLCVGPEHLTAVMGVLRRHRTIASTVIGQVLESGSPAIRIR